MRFELVIRRRSPENRGREQLCKPLEQRHSFTHNLRTPRPAAATESGGGLEYFARNNVTLAPHAKHRSNLSHYSTIQLEFRQVRIAFPLSPLDLTEEVHYAGPAERGTGGSAVSLRGVPNGAAPYSRGRALLLRTRVYYGAKYIYPQVR